MKFKNVFIYPSWRGRPLLNSFYVKSQFCISNGTNDCFTMEEQYFIFTWKFMNIWVQSFLRIALNSYPSEQKYFQSQQQKIAATVSVSSEHFLAWSLFLINYRKWRITVNKSEYSVFLQQGLTWVPFFVKLNESIWEGTFSKYCFKIPIKPPIKDKFKQSI